MTIREARPDDHDALLEIWLRSVRASHAFLTESDIQALLPLVRDAALPALELWVLCSDDDDGAAIGFLGLAESKVEALFLAPEWTRRGGGRMLLDHARRLKGRLAVDEQNPEATRFYEANGFVMVGRSETDADGRPFPILHLREA